MKYKTIFISFLTLLILFNGKLFSQGPGNATNPNPPDSSRNIYWFFQKISWNNPPLAVSNRVLVGIHPDFLTELHSGYLIDSFQIPNPIDVRRTYYWRVDEIDTSGITEGNIWLFTTKQTLNPVFIDSFSNGIVNWTIYNETDSCGWKIKNLFSSYYTPPPTAENYGIVSVQRKMEFRIN